MPTSQWETIQSSDSWIKGQNSRRRLKIYWWIGWFLPRTTFTLSAGFRSKLIRNLTLLTEPKTITLLWLLIGCYYDVLHYGQSAVRVRGFTGCCPINASRLITNSFCSSLLFLFPIFSYGYNFRFRASCMSSFYLTKSHLHLRVISLNFHLDPQPAFKNFAGSVSKSRSQIVRFGSYIKRLLRPFNLFCIVVGFSE